MSLLFKHNNDCESFTKQQKQKQQYQLSLKHHHQQKSSSRTKLQLLFAIFVVFAFSKIAASKASQDLLPNLCDAVKCPPLSELSCPDDSDLRENLLPLAAALLSPMASEATSSPPLTSSLTSTTASVALFMGNTTRSTGGTEYDEELFSQCCLSQKCHCRTCYIPDCKNEYEVIVELMPESPLIPGHCCGQYECQKKPNCTEMRDTENYWLADCQRCKCHSGERICHQSCDEGMRKATAFCKSKTLNQYFEHGDVWKDGCYECECVGGEEKCVMPFCRSVNCPVSRQVLIKDSCCPVCWPKGIPMPNGDEDYDDNGHDVREHDGDEGEDENEMAASGGGRVSGHHNQNYDDTYDDNGDDDDDNEKPLVPLQPQPTDNYASSGNEIDTLLPDINFEKDDATNSLTSSSSSTTTTKKVIGTKVTEAQAPSTTKPVTIMEVLLMDNVISTTVTEAPPSPPCLAAAAASADNERLENSPATYKVYPEVVGVVRQTDQSYFHYIIIGVLGLVIIILVGWNVHLRHKQRSYRPVSNFDDNFNKMSSNIKKMNDYV